MQRWPAGMRIFIALTLLSLSVLSGCQLIFGDVEIGEPGVRDPLNSWGTCGAPFKCIQDYLFECDPDSVTENPWKVSATCSQKLCDPKNGKCRACETEKRQCVPQSDGEHIERCEPDGTWKDTGIVCPPGECGNGTCDPCEPGKVECRGADLRQCGEDQKWHEVETCTTPELCESFVGSTHSQSVVAKCPEGCPAPNAYQCSGVDGATLERCDEGLTGWMRVDTCPSAATCEATKALAEVSEKGTVTQCSVPCEIPGGFRCTGMTLERCNDNQTAWLPLETCEPGKECNPTLGACSDPCTPGEYQCNDRELRRCKNDRTWEVLSTCAHPGLCNANLKACDPPTCPEKGKYECQGAILVKCSDDLKTWLPQQTCASATLCNATSQRCEEPMCDPGKFLCAGEGNQQIFACNADRTAWDPGETPKICASETFCDAASGTCLTECPLSPMCNGKELRSCDPVTGWKTEAICESEALCECAITGTCLNGVGTNGCGRPVCAPNEYRCGGEDGLEVQKCASSRADWEGSGWVCDPGLCYPGDLATNAPGACLACPTANERRCDGNTLRVCSADRRNLNTVSQCAARLGCVDNGTNDYCATCAAVDRWCESAQPKKCNAARNGGDNDGPACVNAALCISNNNSASTCEEPRCKPNERRCEGAQPRVCNADRTGLNNAGAACKSAAHCVDGYCNSCLPTDRSCSGAQPQKCNADGSGYEADGTPCETAALCDNSTGTCLPPKCKPNELKCEGAQRKVCNADRDDWLNDGPACATAALCQQGLETGVCGEAACAANETRCASSTSIETCNAGRTGFGAPEACPTAQPHCVNDRCRACLASDPPTCVGDSRIRRCVDNSWSESSCPMGEQCVGGECVMSECSGNAKRCVGNDVQACEDGQWGPRAACGSATPICIGAGNCVECSPSAVRCNEAGTGTETCGSNGQWGASTACGRATPVCIGMGNCVECNTNAVTCDGNRIKKCVDNQWSYDSCGEQTCMDGQCVPPRACEPPAVRCNAAGTGTQSCGSDGQWGASMACDAATPVCVGMGNCVECNNASAPTCTNDNRVRSCTGNSWVYEECGDQTCVDGACVDAPSTQ